MPIAVLRLKSHVSVDGFQLKIIERTLRTHVMIAAERDEAMLAGDHLVTPRTGYNHHGIYIGNNKVIHYSGGSTGLNKGTVCVTSLFRFQHGKSVRVKYHEERAFDGDDTVARAYLRLGEDEYSLLSNNCEHFATWCIHGIPISEQIKRVETMADQASHSYFLYQEMKLPQPGSFSRLPPQIPSVPMMAEALVPMASKVMTKHVVATAAGFGISSLAAPAATVVVGAVATTLGAPVLLAGGVAVATAYAVGKVWGWLIED